MAAKDEYVLQARLAEQTERYDEMVSSMKKVAEFNAGFNPEERNLFSVAYKNLIGAKRASWRIIGSIEQREVNEEGSKMAMIKAFKETIKSDICITCDEVVGVLDGSVVPNCDSEESKVFYLKMLGDYQRYKAEVLEGDERKKASERSLLSYAEASEASNLHLDPCNPIRLGLALNQSVFFYEIMGKLDKACDLAKDAIQSACKSLEDIDTDETQKDAALILQLLRDNLLLWQDGQDNENDDTELQDVEDDD